MRCLVLTAALLCGCSTSVLSARPATPSEHAAVDALRDAWHAAGRTVPECGPLDRLHVRELPAADLQERCGAAGLERLGAEGYRVAACSRAGQPWVGAPWRGIVYVDREAPPDVVRRLVVHEGAHVLMGCEGGSTDPRHEDAEVWREIVPAATRRLE